MILVYALSVLILVRNEGDSKINKCFFQTICHHQDLASTLSVDIVQTFTYATCQIITIVFYEGLILFLVMKKEGQYDTCPKCLLL